MEEVILEQTIVDGRLGEEGETVSRSVLICFLCLAFSFVFIGLCAVSARPIPANTSSYWHVQSSKLPLAPADEAVLQELPVAKYDQQFGMSLTQNFGNLAFNVTAIAQTDENGYGPAYLLNGLSNTGYWYQVGVSFNWPYVRGGYAQGFAFNFEVFAANQSSVYPLTGGGGLKPFIGKVNSGDSILLVLDFYEGDVVMFAQDWNTGAYALEFFSCEGAEYFVGTPYAPANNNGFFTGLMTEWYHATPYSTDGSKIIYSEDIFPLSYAWMWMDEFNPSDPNWSGMRFASTVGPVDYLQNPLELHSLSFRGNTVSSNAFEFHTGSTVPLSTSITLIPADQSHSLLENDEFKIWYTLNGQNSIAFAKNGTTNIKADNGTNITVSRISSLSTSSEAWILNSKNSNVTMVAGENSTFYFYDVLSQVTSFVGLEGRNPESAAVTYFTAPKDASGKLLLT